MRYIFTGYLAFKGLAILAASILVPELSGAITMGALALAFAPLMAVLEAHR